jgi:hypothetical protein
MHICNIILQKHFIDFPGKKSLNVSMKKIFVCNSTFFNLWYTKQTQKEYFLITFEEDRSKNRHLLPISSEM